jgi:type II restriction enzyme
MPVNADKPERWPADIRASIDLYNRWFMDFAPAAYRAVQDKTIRDALRAMEVTRDLRDLTGEQLRSHPGILPALRMATAPPLAVDRVVGLAGTSRALVGAMERGCLPSRMNQAKVQQEIDAVAAVLQRMFDRHLFSWLDSNTVPTAAERQHAASIIADRLTGAVANPVIRNAQEGRQLSALTAWLEPRGYREQRHPPGESIEMMEPGTFAYRMNVDGGRDGEVKIPVDAVVQPHRPRATGLPLLIEAKSAGDFVNVNKRRKEEADKVRHLRQRHGDAIEYVLLLGGFFDSGYLSYEARAGIDWVWEHRLDDLAAFGI